MREVKYLNPKSFIDRLTSSDLNDYILFQDILPDLDEWRSPKELIDRVNTFCTDKDITIQEFLTDAMIEKLRLAYKEKRKNPRL